MPTPPPDPDDALLDQPTPYRAPLPNTPPYAHIDACRAALEVHRHASLEDPADTDSLDAMIDSLSPRRFRRCHVSNPAHP